MCCSVPQDQLLQYLGVGTTAPSTTGATQPEPWPLTVPSHTLALLVEVLLLRQQRERESKAVRAGADGTIVAMWARFLASLKAAIVGFDNRTEQFEGASDKNFLFVDSIVVVCGTFDLF